MAVTPRATAQLARIAATNPFATIPLIAGRIDFAKLRAKTSPSSRNSRARAAQATAMINSATAVS
jgi:hypothetical protein